MKIKSPKLNKKKIKNNKNNYNHLIFLKKKLIKSKNN